MSKKLFDIDDEAPATVTPKAPAASKAPEKKYTCVAQRRNVIITPELKAKIAAMRKNKSEKVKQNKKAKQANKKGVNNYEQQSLKFSNS